MNDSTENQISSTVKSVWRTYLRISERALIQFVVCFFFRLAKRREMTKQTHKIVTKQNDSCGCCVRFSVMLK